MQLALTLVSPTPDAAQAAIGPITTALAGARARVKEPRVLGPGAIDLSLEADAIAPVRIAVANALEGLPIDACVQPWNGRRKRLLIADMDSTIIGCECIDELADFAGVKDKVSEITERAMRGELDFESALRERVAMLKGLSVDVLQRCYDER
ncbi:MAG: phosphoserine phosphatase SerB, partial [Phenylobacterium sp.]|nr:phosphoserine phosphatase SerB [Phenylobacterium sp.]